MKNILTVDVEDWYHICDVEHILPRSIWGQYESRILFNLEKILALFSRFKVKATFFVLGYIAERTPETVTLIQREGHEVASHGYSHLPVYKQTEEEFLQDLLRSKNLIEGMTGEKVIGYRAPQFSVCGALKQAVASGGSFVAEAGGGKRESHWAIDLLVRNGFLYDSSIAPLHFIGVPKAPIRPYTLSTPHGEIKEYPPLAMPSLFGNLPAGGGWGLRIFSYQSIRRSIEDLNRQGHPGLIYLHPSEFDDFRAPVRLPWIKRFVCYGRIKSTEERVTRLLDDFEFTTAREVLIG
jgi:polysaccharide deacetylase family protein (PEP-CTERM system associated)